MKIAEERALIEDMAEVKIALLGGKINGYEATEGLIARQHRENRWLLRWLAGLTVGLLAHVGISVAELKLPSWIPL